MASQPYPDEQTWWPQVADPAFAATYAEAGLTYPNNAAAYRWANRTSYDIAAGLTKEQSLAKHIAELRVELGLPSTPPNPNPPPPGFAGLVRSEGLVFLGQHGRVEDRLASNFGALIRSDTEQNSYLDWMDEEGLVGSRVFTNCVNLFDLSPEAGRDLLPPYLQKCRDRGKYVQAVGLVDTRLRSFDYGYHLDWLIDLQSRWDNLWLEGGNEARHETQNPDIIPIIIQRQSPFGLYATSSPLDVDDENPEFAQFGNYFEIHANRSNEENGWKWVRHTKEIWNMMTGAGTGHPGVGKHGRNGEPRRDDLREDRHFALGALCRVTSIGDTLHFADGRYGFPPSDSSTQIAMRARGRYRSFIPDSFYGEFFNATWTRSPIKSFTGANRIYTMRDGNRAFSIALDAAHVSIEFGDGFREVDQLRVGDARLYRLEQ